MASALTQSLDEITNIIKENGIEFDNEQRDRLKAILAEYSNDRNQFISALIDGYHHPNTTTMTLSRETIGVILYRHIQITDSDTNNVVQMAAIIIPKLPKGDLVDIDEATAILRVNMAFRTVFS